MSDPSTAGPFVSVVIPTYNRAAVLPRAINSVLGQTHPCLELIIVDDGSTDETRDLVDRLADGRVRYLAHDRSRNAAAARNTGLDATRGEVVAFLDSDDEWSAEHLSRKLRLLDSTGADAAFGSFIEDRRTRTHERRCGPLRDEVSMATYILSGTGDVRSSTLVFRRGPLAEVRFDPGMRKHQDWDIACRFGRRFRFVLDPVSTVTLHHGAERMTGRLDHEATRVFLDRHLPHADERAGARFLALWALRTFRAEGRSAAMREYLARAEPLQKDWPFRVAILALRVPGLDVAFSRAMEAYISSKSGR